jgi:asparagine synthase (glutamine-hydrolysing)
MPYWRFTLERDETLLDPARWPDLCEELRVALEQAVRRRLMSDVPLGVFLSGGVDSSAIAALAARHVPLQTFAVGFSEPTFDETAWARRAAEHIGSEHRTETLALEETPGIAEDLLAGLDEPVADSSILPTALLCRFTRRHVTVALGGDGGDELFAGYDPFRALRPASLYQRWMPRPFHGAVRSLAGLLPVSHTNLSFDFKLKRTLAGLGYPPPLWNPVWMSALEPEEIAQRTGKPAFVEMLYAEAFAAWERCESPHIVDKSLCYWTDIYLRDGILSKVDRASMLASLEARSPFLDRAVVEIARRIPWELKLRGSVTKWILKEALEPILPPEIVHRAKKGFGMPVGRWFRDGRLDLRHTDSGDFSKTRLAAHRAGARDDRLYLWAEWLLERRGVA